MLKYGYRYSYEIGDLKIKLKKGSPTPEYSSRHLIIFIQSTWITHLPGYKTIENCNKITKKQRNRNSHCSTQIHTINLVWNPHTSHLVACKESQRNPSLDWNCTRNDPRKQKKNKFNIERRKQEPRTPTFPLLQPFLSLPFNIKFLLPSN